MRANAELGLLLLAACKEPEAEPIATPPPSAQIEVQAWGADIGIDDYQGIYCVSADMDAEYDTNSVKFDATVIKLPDYSVWYDYVSVGTLTDLDITWAPEGDREGWPAYDIQSTAYIDEYDIELSIDGRFVFDYYLPEYDRVEYSFDGSVTLRMFGEEMTIEEGIYYQDPGKFVGEVNLWSREGVIAAPAGVTPSPATE